MRIAILIATVFTWATLARGAHADSACGSGSHSSCDDDLCPPIVSGDCSNAQRGAHCGADDRNTCQTIVASCRQPDAGPPSDRDAGAFALYCLGICYEEGGCSIEGDGSARRRIAFPTILVVSGILFLVVDRRRRRRRDV
jgi:hypothetical protein